MGLTVRALLGFQHSRAGLPCLAQEEACELRMVV